MASDAAVDLGSEVAQAEVAQDGPGRSEDLPKEIQTKDGMTIIRLLNQEEYLKIRDISFEFHSECRYSYLPFSEEKLIRFYSNTISSPDDTLALVVQHKGETVGVLTAGVGDYYLGVGGRMVTIYVMYVSKKLRGTFLGGKVGIRLIRLASDWAKFQKAEEIHIHSTSGIEPTRTDKLLTRMGFQTYGGNYAAKLEY